MDDLADSGEPPLLSEMRRQEGSGEKKEVYYWLVRAVETTMIKNCLSLVISLLLLSACSSPSSPDKVGKQHGRRITIAQFGHVFLYLPVYVALDRGFFEKEGLDVNLVSTGGDEKTFTAVSSGNAQFGVADPVFAAVARERGRGGKVVASIVGGVPFWVVAFRDDIKPFDSPEGFAGYRVGTYTAPSTSYAVMKMILQNDGKPVDARICEGAFGSLLPMIKAKHADMAMTIEPMVSVAVKEGARVVYSPAAKLGDFAFTGLTVSDEFYAHDKETIQHAVNAIARSMRFIHSDFQGALSVAKKEFPEVEEPVVESALKRLLAQATVPETPVLSEVAWKRAIDLRKLIGDIKGKGSYSENVDPSFAREAVKKLQKGNSSKEGD